MTDRNPIADITARLEARLTARLVDQIRPLLAGRSAGVQGAVLLDLCATWIAGHHPDLRPAITANFTKHLVELIPINEREIFGDRGFPTEGLN